MITMAKSTNGPNTTRQPPTATYPTLTSRLHELISACFTGLYIETREPEEAVRDIPSVPMIGETPAFPLLE